MNRHILRIAALTLALLLPLAALADVTVSSTMTLPKYATLSTATNAYSARVENGYQLFDAQGNAISQAYGDIRTRLNGVYYEVRNENGLNKVGLLDAQGQEILPLTYGEFEFLDETWVLAYTLEPTDADVGEYKDSDGNKYNISKTDVLFEGKVIGSLTREDYTASCQASGQGNYLCIKVNSTACYWLSSKFERVDVKSEDYVSTREFSDEYRKGILHNPTQQYAFVPGCTLTAEDVGQSLWYQFDYKTNVGQLVDLQGNVIKADLPYEYIYYVDDQYIVTKKDGLCGIMNAKGEEIVPPMYKEIPHNDSLFPSGYQACLDKEGRLYYLDTKGNVTASVEYKLDSGDYQGFYNNASMVVVENMGQFLVITATHGELPEKYAGYTRAKGGHTILSVMKGGQWGVIDMAGNVVVPFVHRNALDISADGTVILGCNDAREYVLYTLNYGEAAAEPSVEQAPATDVTDAADAADAATPSGDVWTCPGCKAVNTGKFCVECGSSKPVERLPDAYGWTCPECKTASTGKFCPECGMPKPVEPEKVVCSGCGYEPADGETPKFCPECGQKFRYR